MSKQFRVGILGATGAVGQKFIEVLDGHPWFEITALAASERSAGKPYREAANWLGAAPIPEVIAEQEVVFGAPGLDCDFVFSGLPASVAGDLEPQLARAGFPVISNARNYRMQEDVPLLIPEINPDHIALIDRQDWGSDGFIVTNPNCSTVGLVCALKPLVDAFGVEKVQVTTLQALSGAGYPGVASLDALANVVPHIGGEEDKLATEPCKLLGTLQESHVEPCDLIISAQCNRVPVVDGHLLCISAKLGEKAAPDDVRGAFEQYESPIAHLNLPTAPEHLLRVYDEPHFPQPRRHVHAGRGMTVSMGRIRPCEVLDVKFIALVHNTVRGAAGGAVLNAELLVESGYLVPRKTYAAVG